MCQSGEQGECLVQSESGTATRLLDVSMAVQSIHGWSGQGGECECVGSWLAAVGSEWAKLSVESVTVRDDATLGADSEEQLRRLVWEFGRVCERRTLRVNVGKCKVMRCSRDVDASKVSVLQNLLFLDHVQYFKYLDSHVERTGLVKTEVKSRMKENCKVLGKLKSVTS